MAQTKNALIRQRVIDRCLRSPKLYSVNDMMEKCNIALEEAGYKPVTSKVTILKDLDGIENDSIIVTRIINSFISTEHIMFEFAP